MPRPIGGPSRIALWRETALVRALRREGLTRTGIFGRYHAPPSAFSSAVSLDDLAPAGPFDYVLVCVKAPDTDAAAGEVARHLDFLKAEAPVVLFQNGWGGHEVFARHLPGSRLYNARVITGFTRTKPNCVEITVHADAVRIGTLTGAEPARVEPLCRLVASGGIPCEVSPEVARDLWAKMLYNCALNPLGAIFGVCYGALAESEHTRALMDAIHREVFAVMHRVGYATYWDCPEDYRRVFYGRLVPATAAHEPSMLQDIRAGKRTEIEALNGAVVRLADQAGTPVPVNRSVYLMLRFLEERAMERKAGAGGGVQARN